MALKPKEKQLVAVQANTTDSIFQLYDKRQVKKRDFQCQGPCGDLDAPVCQQILSLAYNSGSFFVCGQHSLLNLLQETARGCRCV